MYKVLLADDEMLDLEGMKQFIPWQQLGLEIVAAVNNGFSACEVIEQQHIDILVTDVNMPNMSGLELARHALDKRSETRIIFVSGYQDFHYVKQALSLNACSYVLKPMDDQELIDSLQRVTKELDETKRRQAADAAYQQAIPMARNELLVRLLDGDSTSTLNDESGFWELAHSYGFQSLQWPIRVAVLEADDVAWKLDAKQESARQELFQSFSAEVLTACLEQDILHVCKLSRQRYALLVSDEKAEAVLRFMLHRIKERLSFTLTIGLGLAVQQLNELSLSYQQATEALDCKMFFGKGKLIAYEQMQRAPEMEDARTLDLRLDALFTAMANYELVRIHDEIENLFLSVLTLRSKCTIHNLAMYIVFKLDQYLHSVDEDLFRLLGMELRNLDILLQFETMDDIRSWLVRKVFEISEMLRRKASTKNGRLIREMQRVVREQMHENITLRDIARQFSFSPNYLGHLFKEETGKSFSEMLIQMRMEKARELLKDPSLKIYEVADQVGYRYLPYFSRQFKETYGMSPMDYRKKE
ncbi:helix-turn-helix domain-containing protein [Paenibacillus sp. 481]|uniref:helix-turn-helix domain-containing protein n=1 Tax=Paenibacillus sp. 481 TaxID=2835869 RepID=UPI001E600BC0|nr:helix-turn-helix domain-containing protein [Paenibacillus sp. 481]UHA72808.1 response regulator [Paenibacillus sp. 481]